MISLKDITYQIDNKEILTNISLDIQKGSFTSIIGPSGAGKTTLARMICGLQNHSGGNLSIDQKLLQNYDAKELARKVSYVSQNSDALSDFSVWDLMELSKYPFWDSSKKLTSDEVELAKLYLQKLDILPLLNRSLNSLSGGERQRVYVASALFQGSEYVVLDEPTSALDPGHQFEIMKLLRQEQSSGKTIIMISHDINMALQISEHLIALKNGRVFYSGGPCEFVRDSQMNELFNLRFKMYSDEGTHIPFLVGWEDV
ncbi:ABC transporter, ATP-binding protein [Bacteriovorax sp. BSW11_IV]|uniref:ABC transporter ATP-binding protein n=1 Tax=Bacteriovorax sp. BSW11_IV TaxID=1353529 RepID=UPI000389FB26|nr:ABC transporter ATP-binding protein [Bacteriovorax sp. BSW11_IV]EQC48321.1 ABC transporter, ATP-binding protein [Bacteriovorax sp. BSW11_IV]